MGNLRRGIQNPLLRSAEGPVGYRQRGAPVGTKYESVNPLHRGGMRRCATTLTLPDYGQGALLPAYRLDSHHITQTHGWDPTHTINHPRINKVHPVPRTVGGRGGRGWGPGLGDEEERGKAGGGGG
jgi:hypothetical protein